MNGKLTHRFSDRDRLFLNAYYGRDIFHFMEEDEYEITGGSNEYRKYDDKTHIRWGNLLTSVRWNHVFNGRLFSNATVAFTDYRMRMGYTTSEKSQDTKYFYKYKFDYGSGIRDLTAKIDFDYTPAPRHIIKFGGEYVNHAYIPETYTTVEKENDKGQMVTDTTYTNKRRKTASDTRCPSTSRMTSRSANG